MEVGTPLVAHSDVVKVPFAGGELGCLLILVPQQIG